MNNDNTITIDLEQPAYSRALDNEFFLQRDAKLKLWYLLKDFKGKADDIVNKNKKNKFSYNKIISNNTVFISGRRGAGKTTFLKTILSVIEDDFSNNKSSESERKNENELNIKTLVGAYFDPTSIDTNQHILIDIITSIKDSLFNSENINNSKEKNIEKINKALFKMSKGLQLLSTKKNDPFSDPSWFLDSALNSSESGLKLVDYLNEFIDEVCDAFGFDLILIAIDDIDTNSDKAYEMLELIRNYFNHPRLVVVISGDLELYSHIVLKRKYEELIISGYNNNSSKINRFEDFCHNMEQQYLAKIFPVENRIELKQFNEVVKDNIIEIEKSDMNYKDYINNKLSIIFNLESRNLKSYISYVEEQPLRTIIQLLVSIHSYKDNNLLIDKMPHIIKNCFLGVLSRGDLDLNGLLNSELHVNKIGYESFKMLNKNEEMETGFYFRPTGNNDEFNSSMVFLNSISQRYLNSDNPTCHLGKSLSFMLTNGASANIYMAYVSDLIKDGFNYSDYLNYIGLNKKDNILSFVSHYSPLLFDKSFSNSSNLYISSGVVRVPRYINNNYKSELIKSIKCINGKVLDEDVKLLTLDKLAINIDCLDLNSLKEFIASFSILSSSHSLVTKSEGRDYCSFYCLLASITDLLLSDDNKVFEKLVSIQNFSAPIFINTEAQGDDSERDEYIIDREVKVNNECFIVLQMMMEKWKRLYVKNIDSSVLMLGKIWVRIFYTINNISFYLRKKIIKDNNNIYTTLDYSFKLFCYGLINSILIEEIRYKNIANLDEKKSKVIEVARIGLIKAKNINSSSSYFYKNFQIVVDECKKQQLELDEIIPFTIAMKKCPLISIFMNDEKNSDDILDLIKLLDNSELIEKINKKNTDIHKIVKNSKNERFSKISLIPILNNKILKG
ncbi:hypothetical protein ACBQ20_16975 [Proteus vulgaris]|uniref:hypothetical protein n=1 Tax=Proteus vulgaris TaxID=585 RepID=UPI00352566EC